MLKIRSTSFTFLSLRNLEVAPEEAMHLRRLIKSSNESLGPYLFGKFNFWNFQGPRAKIPKGGYSTSKSPDLIGLKKNFCIYIYIKNQNFYDKLNVFCTIGYLRSGQQIFSNQIPHNFQTIWFVPVQSGPWGPIPKKQVCSITRRNQSSHF